MPKSFKPKNFDPGKVIKEILEPNSCIRYSDKMFLDELSFNQLEKLVELEDKLDHLKIYFEHKDYKYILTYTPFHVHPGKEGLLSVLQYGSPKYPVELRKIVNEMIPHFNLCEYYSIKDVHYNPMIDFDLKTKIPITKLKEFFKTHIDFKYVKKEFRNKFNDVSIHKFENINIYAEYHNLTKDDMEHIALIPKGHMLHESKTYEFQ